jgi:4-hydroxythreonine-4-phosphate dehydrogenase
MKKPVVAVTFGDASGIGPELVARLLARPEAIAAAQILLVGDRWVWAEGQRIAGITTPVKTIKDFGEARSGDGAPLFLALETVAKTDIVPAQVTVAAGRGARMALAACLDAVRAARSTPSALPR